MLRTIFKQQQVFFRSGITRPHAFRVDALKRLRTNLVEREEDIISALQTDMGKSPQESFMSELYPVYEEIDFMIERIHRWTPPVKVRTSAPMRPSKSLYFHEPKGLVAIFAPWNYPFQLIVMPLIGAVAAGNCVMAKPSSQAPATARLLNELISLSFKVEHVKIIQGPREESEEMLRLPFDHFFFTGSKPVGKKVMHAAADHLASVTLELGGKSPGIIYHDAVLDIAARKIAFGKFLNAGQNCVAYDYLLVHRKVLDPFLALFRKQLKNFYGANPLQNPDYPRIVNARHFERLLRLIQQEVPTCGGQADSDLLKIAPTLVLTDDQSPLMEEEIFGPILPILTYETIEEALEIIRRHDPPLAMYVFTESTTVSEIFIRNLAFGGGCINDGLVQVANPHLPFGGVRSSGIGRYHGFASFETFSNIKSIVASSKSFDFRAKYPPYTAKKLNFIKKIIR